MMNSPFVVGTYVSMIFFSSLLVFIGCILLYIVLLFFNLSLSPPFLVDLAAGTSIIERFINNIWILFVIPIASGLLLYIYPSSESKNLGDKIDQELPFVAIHMSAIATSGVEPSLYSR